MDEPSIDCSVETRLKFVATLEYIRIEEVCRVITLNNQTQTD